MRKTSPASRAPIAASGEAKVVLPEKARSAEAPRWWLSAEPGATSTGLSDAEARAGLARHGPNRIVERTHPRLVTRFVVRFKNPLVLLLLVASAVSAFTGDMANTAIIIPLVLLSVTLDFLQEHRADRAAEKLRESVALHALALRNGKAQEVPVEALVPGDVVLLSAGDRVPADARLLECRDFFVNQGLLTGESFPVEKRPGLLGAGAVELQEAENAVFMGSTVVSGSARALVMTTGQATELGNVARSVLEAPPVTAFDTASRRFGLLIMRLTLLLVLFVLFVSALLHRPLIDALLFAIALAVGLTPELLPMVISVTLSSGAVRMARRRVIVKRLSSIQDLGAMDVLCTDKTGTLTEARIRLERCVDIAGQEAPRVLLLARLNSAFESGLKSALDDAILATGSEAGEWKKIDEVPFDFERRRVSVLIEKADARWLVAKGSPDEVLAACGSYEQNEGQAAALDKEALERARQRIRLLEKQGLRVLAVAWRAVPHDHSHAMLDDESELVLAGFAAFSDPPKAGAAQALADLRGSGVHVKILTGDSDLVAKHLCGLLHLPVAGVLTGRELAGMDEPSLRARVARTTLFCRMNPAQKSRVILALKAHGHVVGYLGDGVNDAPSLRTADVGITVDSAVDVAREVADMVMLDHDLAVLHDGVIEGRRTHANVMKYIMMGSSSNFGNMVSMAAASAFLPFLPMLPAQILLNNVLYDLSEAAIPLDRVDARELRRPRTLSIRFIQRYMMFFGLVSSCFDGLTFYVLLVLLDADAALFRTGWFVESLMSQVLVIFIIRTRGPPWKSRPGRVLVGTSLSVAVAALLLPVTPLGAAMGFVALPPAFFAWLAALLLAYLCTAEMAKRLFFRRLAGHSVA